MGQHNFKHMLKLPPDKQIHALIVEDDPDQVMLYLTKFMIEGMIPIATDNEYDTMHYLLGGGFDIVLLDILLKGDENGIKILKSIKADSRIKDIPVVMFTNYTEKESREKAKALGAVDFIVKADSTPKQVAERVKEIVRKDMKSRGLNCPY